MSSDTVIGKSGGIGNVVRVLSASAQRAALTACAEAYCSGRQAEIRISWATSGAVVQRVRDGATVDLVAASRVALTELKESGLIAERLHDVGISKIALGMRKGEKPPDISTVENFRAAIMSAKSIARGDPAGGGTAGNFLVAMLKDIGVLEATAERSILKVGGYNVMKEVAEGRADFGLTQSTEIVAVEGVEIAAWLPGELQMETAYAIGRTNNSSTSAKSEISSFLLFVTGFEGRKIYKDAGFF